MLATSVRVFVATTPVDLRGSFDRLGGFVRDLLGDDPRSGALFVFMNKAGNRVKILFFDQTGDCILYKRLERGTFHGIIQAPNGDARVEIEAETLKALLPGRTAQKKSGLH